MKNNSYLGLGLVLIVVAFITGYWLNGSMKTSVKNDLIVREDASIFSEGDIGMYASNELGLQFNYPVHPDGYVLQRIEKRAGDDPSLIGALMLMRQTDLNELLNNFEGREGPPTITVLSFETTESDLKKWLEDNQGFANYQEEKLETIMIDGREAITYDWEGLYNGRTVAVLNNEKVFLLTANSTDENDGRYEDFAQVLDSIKFLQLGM